MKLYSENKNYKLYQGNMLDMLEAVEPNSIDSIVTDPPYELNFMGKGWDNAGVSFNANTWKQCYEALKPGGYLLAFGGSRTYHRIAVAIEDAGFEIRDTIMWLYGSGFPKSMNIGLAIDKKNGVEIKSSYIPNDKNNVYGNKFGGGKTDNTLKAQNEWQGWGTALKPSFEPIIVARKPFKGSLVDNVIENGVGGINIDECRVGNEERQNPQAGFIRRGRTDEEVFLGTDKNRPEGTLTVNGRFPANTILTYDETDFGEVCGGFPCTKSQIGARGGQGFHNCLGRPDRERKDGNNLSGYEDSGSASRYFYCAKASKKDRDEGLDSFKQEKVNDGRQTPIDNPFQRGETPRKNTHPTVKPTELMQYLVRLVTPNGGVVLDPFNGSGSTGKAVMYENKERNKNYKYVGIELTDEYLPIAQARIEYVSNIKEIKENQTNIYDFIGE